MITYDIIRTRHNGKESESFNLKRPDGTDDYLFLHFKTPVVFTIFGKKHKLTSGTCIILSPGTPHAFYPDGCKLLHDWIHFMPSENDIFSKLKIDLNAFLYPSDSSFITASVKKCELELIYKDEFYKELVSSEMTKMFIKLKRQLKENVLSYHTNDFKSLRIDMYRNPHKYLNTSDMAKSVNLSRSRFSVLYKELFDISPQLDHINSKISKASYLLSVGTLSLNEISEMCGYQNIYHFIRQFRQVVGVTPGQYRKNH